MGALFGEDLAQDVARLYGRRSRQEPRTLMSVPQPQPHTGSSEETPRPISTTANNSDIVSSLRAAISSAQRTLTSDTVTAASSTHPTMSITFQPTDPNQPSDANAAPAADTNQLESINALPDVETNSTAAGLTESSTNHLPLHLFPPANESAMDHSPVQESASNQDSLVDTSDQLPTPVLATQPESLPAAANQQSVLISPVNLASALDSTANQASVQESSANQVTEPPVLSSLTNESSVSGIAQETEEDRPCTPPSLFAGRADPVPPPQPEAQPDLPIPLSTLSRESGK